MTKKTKQATPVVRGRPALWKEDWIERGMQYLKECHQQGKIPNQAGLGIRLGVSKRTVQEYSKKNDDFGLLNEMMLTYQEDALINIDYKKQNMAKFLLEFIHGYKVSSNEPEDLPAPKITIVKPTKE